jgi:hypothetical protein
MVALPFKLEKMLKAGTASARPEMAPGTTVAPAEVETRVRETMVLAALILILSTAFFFFHLQVTCQRILRRQFDRAYFLAIVKANRLEFLGVRRTLGESNAAVDFPRLRMMLKCDFRALTYLLKNAVNLNQRYSHEDRLLMLYFRLVLASLVTRHWLRVREKPSILKLTAILQYFANVVGQRVNTTRFANLTASSYPLDL